MLPYLVEHTIGYYLWRIRSKVLLADYHKKVGIYGNMIRWRSNLSIITRLFSDSSVSVMYFGGNNYKHMGAIYRFTTEQISGMRVPNYYTHWHLVNIPVVNNCGCVVSRIFIDCLELADNK